MLEIKHKRKKTKELKRDSEAKGGLFSLWVGEHL